METDNMVNDLCFIIDSDSIKEVQSHIYGWLVSDNKVYMNCDIPPGMLITSDMMGI